uniref:NADH dehydrogenase subunit 6 n=1 Tax=Pauropus longiramus TaxID=933850 RepID=G9BG49_9MYRI|nr:NADH dehydrogenase subunit 6 [Pauropus longiramus]ADT63087.1 NADH dehydrogenase subunit 6 [Pauropus longiramus]
MLSPSMNKNLLMKSLMIMIMSFYPLLTSPILLLIFLMLLSIFMTMTIFILLNNSLIPIMFFLLFLGGILILFSYLSTLCPNEKMKSLKPSLLLMMLLLSHLMLTPNLPYPKNNFYLSSSKINSLSMLNIFSSHIIFLMILILFILMVLLNLLTNKWMGPLRLLK